MAATHYWVAAVILLGGCRNYRERGGDDSEGDGGRGYADDGGDGGNNDIKRQ